MESSLLGGLGTPESSELVLSSSEKLSCIFEELAPPREITGLWDLVANPVAMELMVFLSWMVMRLAAGYSAADLELSLELRLSAREHSDVEELDAVDVVMTESGLSGSRRGDLLVIFGGGSSFGVMLTSCWLLDPRVVNLVVTLSSFPRAPGLLFESLF